MSAVKFSKQYIKPNPSEVDYWIDLTSNPYGGRIKYNNGVDWVDLFSSGKATVNLDNYFTKSQINQMLSAKASIESVNTKVDDTEIADVIKNIEVKDRDGSGVELVLLKYDDTTVGVTLPAASSTTSGVLTADEFKSIVKQYQLQELYTEMYDKLAEIRSLYQPRLSAGKNIMIDRTTNTIHATGKISTEWEDLVNVPDLAMQPDLEAEVERATHAEEVLDTKIQSHVTVVETSLDLKADKADTYTKNQIDSKLSGVYRIKGSCLFEQLPTDPTVGDTWNIINDFTLNGEEHPFGTNVVYTDNGWDALAGIFDSSELEGNIGGVAEALALETIRATKAEQANADNINDVRATYLPLTGGTITGGYRTLIVKRNAAFSSTISYENTLGTLGAIGIESNGKPIFVDKDAVTYDLYHSGNFNPSDYLPLSGGFIKNNAFKFGNTDNINGAYTLIYKNASNTIDYGTVIRDISNKLNNTVSSSIILSTFNGLQYTKNNNVYKIWHEGNDGPGSGLDADTLDGKHHNFFAYVVPDLHNMDCNAPIYNSHAAIYRFSNTPINAFPDAAFGNMIVIGNGMDTMFQLGASYSKNTLYFRTGPYRPSLSVPYNRNWKEVAFTDSDITGNAATATKLQTPVKLWGNNFDGSSDVNGRAFIDQISVGMAPTSINGMATGWGNVYTDVNGMDRPWYGLTFSGKNSKDTLHLSSYYGMTFKAGHSGPFVFDGGNVGIGTIDPLYKLDVNGASRFRNYVMLSADTPICYYDVNTKLNLNTLYVGGPKLLELGLDTSTLEYDTVINGNNTIVKYGTSHATGMILNSSGNVTIGNSDLAGTNHKLYVGGSSRFNGPIILNNGESLCAKTTDDDDLELIKLSNANELIIGGNVGKANNGTRICGYTLRFRYGSGAQADAMFINAAGNVGIGTVTPTSKLHVNGNTTTAGLHVTNKITSGDLVDWYGVSWSEDSSDPTCTRIGNMALHRSLPILSAMLGYMVGNDLSIIGGVIVPLTEKWEAKYTFESNAIANTATSWGGMSTMVKIPEFWYIDDYEPNTKTHNLKISQTAKAGWCHHKEAYVGAYEGSSSVDGTYYQSKKGLIPIVSASRNTLRSMARANGYEDEYKWNIYTYEEHRAICHLFLVEYATRNSQAPVNTALTPDGFKQGGLGSGCTTGTVTINGQTMYSFIPTGTTDSLGNGSGQVAYTVTLTDADGNEIGTVTRYANRYRGIENPFGHIWKHVDDIVNVYNAETTYKTVYKCNKPEHFATNKNAKYKPLCSFPSGSKMQGWSKEIKATINCDFFKYSVGGSESTYWCDYNYDNDDTSEHCLLIGGGSDYGGGKAGLFRFPLHNGVSYSSVYIGSRLTYLPWAE